MPTLDKTIAQLNYLLMTCHDASLSYRRLAGSASTSEQQRLFREREQQCSALMACLHNQIVTYGGRPAQHPSLFGMLRHAWNSVTTSLLPERGRARLRAALRTEKQIRHGFEQVLAEQLSPQFRQQLQEHSSRSVQFERRFRARLE
ncbi:PA2169 family four-helix-bundle protein [Ectopseudomonas chengduensis]